ncbi:hypothetical protein AB6A40_004460 [Gnathostoma spinigerum]|uniref:Uncharacterized protein n=1 Tax=Gnathostoma spinigerum TaxID=75299 RepID=A0ABD6EDM8_9BILA
MFCEKLQEQDIDPRWLYGFAGFIGFVLLVCLFVVIRELERSTLRGLVLGICLSLSLRLPIDLFATKLTTLSEDASETRMRRGKARCSVIDLPPRYSETVPPSYEWAIAHQKATRRGSL